MGELPEKFPEYSIMYRTISNKIKSLQKQKEEVQDTTEINSKIIKYQKELDRIKKMFPYNFFEN